MLLRASVLFVEGVVMLATPHLEERVFEETTEWEKQQQQRHQN